MGDSTQVREVFVRGSWLVDFVDVVEIDNVQGCFGGCRRNRCAIFDATPSIGEHSEFEVYFPHDDGLRPSPEWPIATERTNALPRPHKIAHRVTFYD